MAAGFSFRMGREAEIRAFLAERLSHAAALPGAADLVVEGAVAVPGAGVDLAQQIARLAPFGAGNEEPVFILNRARVVRADRVGKEGNTVRAFLEGEGGGPRLKAIMFRAKEGPVAEALLARGGAPMHLAGHLRAESWNDTTTACLHLVDAAPAG
jgi:single-stranded-DNA-specific exonuclease